MCTVLKACGSTVWPYLPAPEDLSGEAKVRILSPEGPGADLPEKRCSPSLSGCEGQNRAEKRLFNNLGCMMSQGGWKRVSYD